MVEIEKIPPGEAQQIQHIVELTLRQLQKRYPNRKRTLRGVHAKDHGCVTAEFAVREDLPESLRAGVFAKAGRKYSALVRFSNAAVLVLPDSKAGVAGGPPEHGSRGMAIKLLDVEGEPLEVVHGAPTQDFLMINQPVFAFANVEDYEVLSRVLLDHNDDGRPFFAERLPKPGTQNPTESQMRALETLNLVTRIRAANVTAQPPAFQPPPASPVDNDYFSASPFLFGPDRVMRFRARPVNRSHDEPDVADENYLRSALTARLKDFHAGPVVFQFEVQVRSSDTLLPERDIENASRDWPSEPAYQQVATLTIPLQRFNSRRHRERCERLFFTPWHGLKDHRPLGGINRLRRAVYEASAKLRSLPKEPG